MFDRTDENPPKPTTSAPQPVADAAPSATSTAEIQIHIDQLEHYRALYEAMVRYFPNGGVHLFDHDLRFIISDGQELDRIGLGDDPFLGKTLGEALDAEATATLAPYYRAALDGQTSSFEFPYGDQVYRAYTLPVYSTDGTLLAGMVMTQNITDLKQIAADLREQQALLRALVNHAPASIFIKDLAGRYLLVNQTFCTMYGLSAAPEAMQGATSHDLGQPPDVTALFDERDRLTLERGTAQHFEDTVTLDGTPQTFSTVLFPIFNEQHELFGLGGITTNITPLRSTETALSRIEQRYSAIISDTSDLVCRTNPAGVITFVTQAYANLFNLSKEDLIGRDFFSVIPQTHRHEVRELMEKITVAEPAIEYDFIGTDITGQLAWRHWQVQAIFDANNQLVEYQTVGIDYTERLVVERQLAQQTRRAATLARIAAHLNTSVTMHGVLDAICQELLTLLNLPIAIVYLYDPARQAAMYAHSIGLTPAQTDQLLPLPLNNLRLPTTRVSGVRVFADVQQETWMSNTPLHREIGATTLISVQMFRQQEFIGALSLIATDQPCELEYEELIMLRGVADLATQAIINARLFQSIEQLATRDPLTNLYNRHYLSEQGNRALAALPDPPTDDTCVGLIYLDLDRFKQINDTLGHTTGDLTLQKVAHDLQRAAPDDALLARMGGDEFAVLLTHTTPARVGMIARDIHETISQIYNAGSHQFSLGGSMGVVTEHRTSTHFARLLTRADIAMYRAKQQGGGIQVYDDEMHAHVMHNVQLALDLQRALQREQLVLHYQPIVDAEDRQNLMMEALVRWQHPQRGLLRPATFLPIAEEHGLIQRLDLEVVRLALREASRWWHAGQSLGITINLSAASIFRKDLVASIAQMLTTSDVPANYVVFELSEQTILHDFGDIQRTLNELKCTGVQIALDDFGSGFGSLAYIQQLPLDMVKIDRDFTCAIGNEPRAEIILRSMISLSNSLGLTTVVEGVETEEQIAWLVNNGCSYVQGYLTGKPAPLS